MNWSVNCDHCTWAKRVKPSRRYIKNVGNEYHAYDKKAHEMIFDHVAKMHKGMGVKIHTNDGYPEIIVDGMDTSVDEYVLENREWCRV